MKIKCPACKQYEASIDKKDLSVSCANCKLTRRLSSRAEARRMEQQAQDRTANPKS